MKNIILTSAILLLTVLCFAQKNELKFNIPYAIYGMPEITYERLVEDNMGVGIAAAIGIDKPYDWESYSGIPERAVICSYYRLYFSEKKKGAGFFVEGNMGLARQKETDYELIYDPATQTYNPRSITLNTTGFGFGAAVGFKLITKNNIFGDFYGGWGRLFGNNVYNSYPRLGVCLGKRF
jgi:hypothetical protein